MTDTPEKFVERVTEKDRRIYYQDLVYITCNFVDKVLGRRVSQGTGTVCGTADEPSDGLQKALAECTSIIETLVAERDAARAEIERLRNALSISIEAEKIRLGRA